MLYQGVMKRTEALKQINNYFSSGKFEKDLAQQVAYKTE